MIRLVGKLALNEIVATVHSFKIDRSTRTYTLNVYWGACLKASFCATVAHKRLHPKIRLEGKMTHCATRTSNLICATWSQLLFLKATIRDNHGNTAHILITSLSSNETPFSENGKDKTGLCLCTLMVVEEKRSNNQPALVLDLQLFLQWMHPPHVCSRTQMHFCPLVQTKISIQ